MSDIRVLLVDDHPVVRAGVAGMLAAEPGLVIVGEAADGASAIALVADCDPDVVLMDLRMPGMDGVAATTELRRTYPGVRVVVLTTYDSDRDILRAVEAGAAGYLLKDATAAELASAVRRAAGGETVLAPVAASRLVDRIRRPQTERLTARETEVLRLVADGLSNVQIGNHLHIAEATVKTHLLRAFVKLGVDDRTHAVTVAMSRGLIPYPGD
ncbi:MAG TPA: response regulator transcription factor [Jatrophihabitantaceae bacterium]|nr:response regulator transcription factor [Jatrophihabitantaceae bacterium]